MFRVLGFLTKKEGIAMREFVEYYAFSVVGADGPVRQRRRRENRRNESDNLFGFCSDSVGAASSNRRPYAPPLLSHQQDDSNE